VRSEHRDGLLALIGLLGLVGVAAATVGVERLFDPVGAAVGIVAAIAIEAAFLEYPSWLLGLRERRGVPVAAAGAVLGVAVWGLVTYLVLLGCVLLRRAG
jgi:hypothetical protein